MQPKKITYPLLFGRPVLSAVREKNPSASPADLRRILGAAEPIPRDRLPDNLFMDFPGLVQQRWLADIPSEFYGKPVAVIGAGAAGLCAGYELMKCGLTPVFFELETTSGGAARPGGRANSCDFPNLKVGGKKTVGELGCMRFPKSHTTLRTYVDKVFRGEYSYARPPGEIPTQWPEFKDPLLLDAADNTVVYDTDLYARGINGRKALRIKAGTRFADLPKALQDVSNSFAALMGDDGPVLKDILGAYARGDEQAVLDEWEKLNAQYQDRSIFEVLRDLKWATTPAGDGGATLLDIFGELGLGSGGFDAFWGTTFMEVVRIKLHQDETGQDAFLGGSSYMLRPFITHSAVCANAPGGRRMYDLTRGHVVTSPVVRIVKDEKRQKLVRIDCEEEGRQYFFPCAILTASPAAISSSIYITEELLSEGAWKGIRSIPLTGCGKIFAAFDEVIWRNQEGGDTVVTSVTDEALRQVYTFDDYHWGSGSPAGVLMMSYTWGDWAHKMGSLPPDEQVRSALRMLPGVIADPKANSAFIAKIGAAIEAGNIRAVNWSHERGFAGGYRMADLNRYQDQGDMSYAGVVPNDPDSPVFLAGEAAAWLGLSGWIEGALHTGINSAFGVTGWFKDYGSKVDWSEVTPISQIRGTDFGFPTAPGTIPYNPSGKED